MSHPAVLALDFFPISRCLSCHNIRHVSCPRIPSRTRTRCYWKSSSSGSRIILISRQQIACQALTETEPDSNDDKDKKVIEDETSSPPVDGLLQDNGRPDPNPTVNQNEDETESTRLIDPDFEKNDVDSVAEASFQVEDDEQEVARGSPLPGMRQSGELIKIPKATIDVLKDQVFGFDTLFVTSHEPYERGVLFRGNLRGKADKSYEKIKKRLQDKFGDQYELFLLINPEDDKPVAVVVPKQTLQPESTAVPGWFAAAAFGLVTIFTLLLRNVPALQSNLLSTFENLSLLKDGLPGALVTAIVLASHEVGHVYVARDIGAKIGFPYFVPSWQIGSFGAITRIISIISSREDLLKLAAAGPLAGFSVGLVLLLLGFIFPPGDGIGVLLDPAVFHESLLVGGIAKLLLGDALKEGTTLSLNPLVLWAWAGLLINALNSIPAGELDGGRISFALWGRKTSSRLTGAALALLGVCSFFNDVAFYWVVLIFFLQRGPIAPLSEEITEPKSEYAALGVAVLILGLLVCLPYPLPFAAESMSFDL